MWEIPLTGFWQSRENPVFVKLRDLWPMPQHQLGQASAFFFFVHQSSFRDVIHRFKYRGGWGLAYSMGVWFGAELAKSGLYDDVEVIVPVPLHPRRLLKRGYNQAEYLARGIARSLGKPVVTGAVVRSRYNKSQTTRDRQGRWDNVRGIFTLRRPSLLANRHILLVDDVLTTGATLISCSEAILSASPPSTKISTVTLATTRNI